MFPWIQVANHLPYLRPKYILSLQDAMGEEKEHRPTLVGLGIITWWASIFLASSYVGCLVTRVGLILSK